MGSPDAGIFGTTKTKFLIRILWQVVSKKLRWIKNVNVNTHERSILTIDFSFLTLWGTCAHETLFHVASASALQFVLLQLVKGYQRCQKFSLIQHHQLVSWVAQVSLHLVARDCAKRAEQALQPNIQGRLGALF